MSLGIAGDHQIGCPEAPEDRLPGQRRVLIVVDQQVVEEGFSLARQGGSPLEQPGEVHEAELVHDRLVLAQEAGELVPSCEPTAVGGLVDVVGRTQCLLRPEQELADLVGEPAEPQE